MLPPLVPDRAAATRFQRCVRLAVLAEPRGDDAMRRGEAARGIAGGKALVRDQVGVERVVHQRGAGCEGGSGIDDRRQRLIGHSDLFRRVLGLVACSGDDTGDQVAIEADLVDGHGFDRDGFQPVDRRRHAQRIGPLREIGTGGDQFDARHHAGGVGVDTQDACMRVGGADETRDQGARKHQVVEIAAASGQEALVLPPPRAVADHAHGSKFGQQGPVGKPARSAA